MEVRAVVHPVPGDPAPSPCSHLNALGRAFLSCLLLLGPHYSCIWGTYNFDTPAGLHRPPSSKLHCLR